MWSSGLYCIKGGDRLPKRAHKGKGAGYREGGAEVRVSDEEKVGVGICCHLRTHHAAKEHRLRKERERLVGPACRRVP